MSLTLVIQGVVLGVAAVLPGLSTSVAAVLMGMYNELIALIDNVRKDFKGSFKKLLPLGIGAIVGILISVKLILNVCEIYPVQSYFFFAGLVIGGFPVVLRKTKQKPFKPQYLLISVVCFGIMYVIALFNQDTGSEIVAIQTLDSISSFLKMMFAGAFSVSLMAIPGVSGSIMLMIVGQYGTVYNSTDQAINMIKHLINGDMIAFKESLMSVMLLIPFVLGALVGVLLIAKLLTFLIEKCEFAVYYGVIGILLCSVFTLAQSALVNYWPSGNTSSQNIVLGVICVLLVVVGAVCTLFLDKPADEKPKTK